MTEINVKNYIFDYAIHHMTNADNILEHLKSNKDRILIDYHLTTIGIFGLIPGFVLTMKNKTNIITKIKGEKIEQKTMVRNII